MKTLLALLVMTVVTATAAQAGPSFGVTIGVNGMAVSYDNNGQQVPTQYHQVYYQDNTSKVYDSYGYTQGGVYYQRANQECRPQNYQHSYERNDRRWPSDYSR